MTSSKKAVRNGIKARYKKLLQTFKDKGVDVMKVRKLVTLTLRNQDFENGKTYNKSRYALVKQIPVLDSYTLLNKEQIEALFVAMGIAPQQPKEETPEEVEQ